jgi:hypothetical protein
MAKADKIPAPQGERLGLSDLVRDLGSLTAILLGIGYISGFLVVQTYLGSVGVVPFGLLSVQYLAAGMLFVCAVGLVWVPAWAGEMIVQTMLAESRKAKEPPERAFVSSFKGRVVGATSGWFLGGLVLYIAGVRVGDILFWLAFAYVPHVLLRFRYEMGTPAYGASRSARFALFGFPLFVVTLIGLAGMFGTLIYPQIDRAIGGGRPVRLELELDQIGQEAPSGPYDVIAVTDHHWILRDTTGRAHYIISNDKVKAATLRGETASVFGRWFRRKE